jgi:PhnB protein
VQIQPYLFFPGNTREVVAFYQQVFGGDLTITSVGDVDPGASEAEKDRVINAALAFDGLILRCSDRDDATGDSQTRVALTLNGPDEARLRKVYDDLSAGGSADAPLEKQFWGDTFGVLTDRFGINWQVNIEAPKA